MPGIVLPRIAPKSSGPSQAELFSGAKGPTQAELLAGTSTGGKTQAELLGGSPKKAGGGFLGALGSIAHDVAAPVEAANGFSEKLFSGLASKAVHAPGGIYSIGKIGGSDLAAHIAVPLHLGSQANANEHDKQLDKLAEGIAKSTATSIEHPLRDPSATLLNVLPIAHGLASAGVRTAAAVDAAKTGAGISDLAKAIVTKPVSKPRLITIDGEQRSLHPAQAPLPRLLQAGHDKVIQHALDTKPASSLSPKELRPGGQFGLGSYATKRLGASEQEALRARTAMISAPADRLESEGAKLGGLVRGSKAAGKAKGGLGQRQIEQAALRLTGVQRTPAEEIAFRQGNLDEIKTRTAALKNPGLTDAERGAHQDRLDELGTAKDQLHQAALAKAVESQGITALSPEGHVVIDAAKHPHLADVDAQLASVGSELDKNNERLGLMSADALKARRDAPNQITAGATYEKPTPAKLGVPSSSLTGMRSYVARLEQLHARAVDRASDKATPYGNVHTRTGLVKQNLKTAPEAAFKRQHVEVAPGPKTPGVPSDLPAKGSNTPITERLGAALSVARDRLTQMEAAAEKRVKPTGIVGAEGAREGRQYIPDYTTEAKNSQAAPAKSPSGVVGKPKSPIGSHAFTGANQIAARVPDNTTGLVARQARRVYKYVATDEFRRNLPGHAARQSNRDVLVNTQELPAARADRSGVDRAGKVTDELHALVGNKHLTIDELEGHHAAFQEWLDRIIPGRTDTFNKEKAYGIGEKAPAGYKWVDRNLLGDLTKVARSEPTLAGKAFDTINSAQTAATVYFKLGHIGTRVFTNAATNLIQGSLNRGDLTASYKLWHELTPAERDQAIAGSGHGYVASLPHEGANVVGRAARFGANMWRNVDAPFRFNSIAFEARKAGFDTPDKFRGFLKDLAHPNDLSPADRATVEGVAKNANREGIAYDRLNDFERRYLSRGIWFYPWVKGSTVFAARMLAEHPYKSSVTGQLGSVGEQQQKQDLGELPSFEQGLFKIGGSSYAPTVMDASTFSPLSTPAEVTNAATNWNHPLSSETPANFFSPAIAAAYKLAAHLNPYEDSTSKHSTIHDLLSGFGSTTPEAALIAALLATPQNQSRKMFPANRRYGIEKFLGGPATPRTMNRLVANRSAITEQRSR